MSLQGTFDTLGVTELFGLLSAAGKTGALRLEGADEGHESDAADADVRAPEAAIFVTGGLCCGIDSELASGRAESEPELAAHLVDVGFSLARCRSGSFRFTDGEQPPFESVATTAFEPAVAEIESLLDQWQEIEATIPSLDGRVRLSPVLRSDQITLNAAEWSLLVAFDGMPTVRELIALHDEPMIEICRTVKELVDRGAIEIGGFGDRASSEARVARGHKRPGAGAAAHIEVVEPYAPASPPSPVAAEISATADAIAALERDDATAAAEADVVASDLVTRMSKGRRSVPDVFADGDDDETSDVDVVIGEAETDDVPQDRGALLRLFSALKDS